MALPAKLAHVNNGRTLFALHEWRYGMFLADYHTHSTFSPDGRDGFPAMLEAARGTGLTELCVTDHRDILSGRPFLTQERYDAFLTERAMNKTDVKLLLGIELGEATHDLTEAEEAVSAVPYDFIIGSYHALKGERDFYHLKCETEDELHQALARYFAELPELIAWGKFDVLGHLNYPLRYTALPVKTLLPRYGDELRNVFRLLRDAGKGIELNMSGQKKLPFKEILALWRECGGEIVTVGSDGHRAADVGRGVAEGFELLRDVGFRFVAAYEQRRVRFEGI
jgi:histidinol-phosphatase (PHP family)